MDMNVYRSKIVLVDDNLATLKQGKSLLQACYRVATAQSGATLFEHLEHDIPDLILLDVAMPEMDGFEAIKRLKADARHRDIPVIFLTAKSDEVSELEGFGLGAVDYITKPFSGPILHRRIANQLLYARAQAALKDHTENLEAKVQEQLEELIELKAAIISSVADLIEFRDRQTGSHTTRTQQYMAAMIRELIRQGRYVENDKLDALLHLSQLHDVGKIAIPDHILNKPGKLTAEEFEIMKTHVSIGVAILEKIMANTKAKDFLHYALLIAGTHHEKWDGSGYPNGLAGEDIPLEGRIMALADVYDALISERPYKNAFSHEEARRIIIEGSGTHFDPDLVDVFLRVEHEFIEAMLDKSG